MSQVAQQRLSIKSFSFAYNLLVNNMKIIIDPYRGGDDYGAKIGDKYEKDILLDLSKHQPDLISFSESYKDSIDKVSKGKNNTFVPPSVDEVRDYCFERNNSVDPEEFVDFYTSKGWLIGKNKMKDWKAAVRTWERSSKPKKKETNVFDEWRNA